MWIGIFPIILVIEHKTTETLVLIDNIDNKTIFQDGYGIFESIWRLGKQIFGLAMVVYLLSHDRAMSEVF